MNPPKGMVSPRGPVFAAIIERVEAPDPDTVVIHGKGPSGLLLPLFANGWNVIIPKHIAEKDPVNALKTTVIGTGPFRLKEPPTSSLWKYERNPDYFKKDLPFLDEIEIHIITDPQALVAAILSKRVFWSGLVPASQCGPRPVPSGSATESQSRPLLELDVDRPTSHDANRETALR